MKLGALGMGALLVLVGCARGCEDDSSGGGGNGAGGSQAKRVVTEDGYEVVLADPSGRIDPPTKNQPTKQQRDRLIRTPTSPDPEGGQYTLEEAVEGLGTDGTLIAEINTDLGTIFCDLYGDKTPNTVANFVGLARGRRPWWDARAGAWVTRPMYSGTTFHRVIPGYMIQGGDYLGDGSGTIGYTIPDEVRPELIHDRAGLLCMAREEANENGGQFFITDGAAAQLDGSYTIFGRCHPPEVVQRIARVPQAGPPDNRPLTPVVIERILIRRQRGGAAQAKRSPPVLPEGFDPEHPERGASPGPSEIRNRRQRGGGETETP